MSAWMTLVFRSERMANGQDAAGSDRESEDFVITGASKSYPVMEVDWAGTND